MKSGCLKRCRRKLLALAVASCFAAELAHGNPTGPAVARGQASFATQGNTLTVTNSPGTVINWQSFSIPSQEITRFLQQSAASAVLNRVTGSTPSSILGQMQSNGRVYLINPNGITIGQGAVIDVAGFVASSLNLSDADFAAGSLRFMETPGAGAVINRGEIKTSSGGMVYLVGQSVENHGVIKTPEGEIVLAAGKSIELVDAGTPEIRVQITAPDNQALNLGQLLASGGRIGMYAGLVRHGGTANANTAVVGENGKIVFRATKSVTLEAGSVTTASGPTAGSIEIEAETGTAIVAGLVEANATAGRGGSIEISGQQGVTLESTGRLSANGVDGGAVALTSTAGPVRVAGQISVDASAGRGGQVAIVAATQTSIATSARVTANGTQGGGLVSVAGNESVLLETGSSVQANGAAGGVVTVEASQGSVDINGAIEAIGGAADGGIIRIAALTGVTLGDSGVLSVLGNHGGEVRVEAWDGTTLVSGLINAFGGDGQGGKVLLLGSRVGLIRNARVNVSGQRGGGVALVGGDFQGGNPDIQNAERTYVGADARITADAIETGDGGKVIVWADGDTRYYGTITARGGAHSGNGGFVEVSGKEILNFYGRIDVSAPAGRAGTILLDPRDIIVQDTDPGADNGQIADSAILFADGTATTTYTISDEALEGLTGNIVLQATRDITVSAGLSGGLTLTNQTGGERVVLQAGRHVKIDSPLTTYGAAIWLEADSPHSNGYPATAGTSGADGAGAVRISASVQSFDSGADPLGATGGKITLIAGTSTSGGTNGGGFDLNADVNAGAGGIDVALSTQSTGQLNFFIGSAGQAQFTSSDTGQLKSTGQLRIGQATTAGSDGLGPLGLNNQITIKVDQLAVGTSAGGPVTLADTAGTSLVLTAGDGGILVDRDLSTDQTTSISTTGALTINAPLTTNGNNLNITAASVSGFENIFGAGTINCSGTGCVTEITWDGGGGNLNWFTAANWSGDVVPTIANDVKILSSTGTIVISGGDAFAKSLIADVSLMVSNTGSLDLAQASQFTQGFSLSGSLLGTGPVAVQGGGVLSWSGGVPGSTMGSGGMFTVGVGGSGTLSGILTLNRAFVNSGLLTLGASSVGAAISGAITGSITNSAKMTAELGTSNSIGVALSNNPATSLIEVLGSLTAASFPSNAGQITVGSSGTFSTGAASLANAGAGAIVVDAGGTFAVNSGTFDNSGLATFNGAASVGTLTLTAGTVGGTGDLTATTDFNKTAGTLGTTFTNLALAKSGNFSVDSVGFTASNSVRLTATGDITLGGSITATSGTGNSIVIAAGGNFINNVGSSVLSPGASGRWLVYSTSPAGSTENGLTAAAGSTLPRLYNRTYAGNPPASISEPGNHLIYSNQPTLTVTPDNKVKVYGADDPAQTFVATGFVDDDGVIDTTVSAGLAGSFSRGVGESVGARSITQGTFASGAGYGITFTGGQTLTIGQAGLTGAIANQNKTYGADDPLLSGIGVTLGGLVNRTVSTWDGNVAVNDSGLTSTVSDLTRGVGENVGVYNITAGLFSAASGNYSAPVLTGSPTLTIGQAGLTGAIANQNKTYGADDPLLSGIGVTLGGLVNRTVSTWDGNVAVNDSGLTSTVSDLTRGVGENVGVYNITAGLFSAASGNYSAPVLTGSPTLTIGQAGLTGAIANQNKTYGADDPLLSGIGVTLGGLVNRTVSTWDGNVAVNDSGLTSTVSDLTRGVGENVGVYNITAGLFSAASGNYSAPVLTGSPTLTIGQAGLTGAIANQNKTYGADDPLLSGIGVTLGGLVNRTVSTWDGNVAVNDSGLTSTVSDLTRGVGENVGVYNITAGLFSAASGNYSAPVLTGSPTLTIGQAGLTGAIANQNKTYGADDPLLSGIGVTLGGLVNRTVSTWDGNVAVNDSGLTSTVSDLTRGVGENVGVYNITAGLFSAASGNYSAPVLTGSPTLTIGQAGLTGAIANQNKTYGADDPLLSGIGVTLGGLVNRTVSTWDGNVAVNDSGLTSTVSDLTRGVGENVGVYNITAGLFSAASGNYSAPVLTGSPTLTIGQAGLTGAIANQNKTYGADDPLLSGIGVTLGGLVNRTVSTWDGNVAVNDSGLTSTVSDLTRGVGENVGVYNITAGLFSAASGNYSAPVLTGSPTLTIGQAGLTGAIANQNKTYGADDPLLSGIGVTLGGLVNRTVSTWDGNVAVNDSGLTSTVSDLTRGVGENVGVYNITAGLFSAASGNYSAPVLTGSPTLTIGQAGLTGAIANQNKTYGADDPLLSGIGVTLGGLVNRTVSTWDGNVAVNDSGLTSTVSDLTRGVGENVGVYNITAGLFSAASGNYSAPVLTGSPTLTIGQAGLTGAIANQNKTYGADDPLLSGIGVTLGGLVNRTVSTWDGNVAVNDSGLTSTVSDLTRGVGENVGVYNITAGLFSAASGNYSAPVLTGSPTLTIGQAGLTGAIANQNKTYGADDPLLSGIGVTLGGLVNRTVSTWDGNVAVNDSGLTSTVSDLTRGVGENVGVYNITAGLFSAASGNYSAPVLTGSPTLTIGQAGLTGAIANQNKTYGADDPLLSGIGVTLGGLVNRTVSTWDGNVAVNDSGLTSTVSDLTRGVGENVGVYNITAGLFSAASGNYSAPVLTGSPTLTIGQAGLTGAIANQNKTYGADDPLLSGIGVTLGGLVNRTVSTWDGNVAVNDSGLTSTVSDLTRGVGENVGVYNITAGLFSAASGNYSAPVLTGSPTLTIGQAGLTGAIANQNKTYGADDPLLSGIGVTLGGLVNRTVSTWDGNVAVNDSGLTSTVSDLTRGVGENVGVYNITAGLFSAASGNYSAPVLTGSPTLTIGQAGLTGAIANQNKTYGADDPLLSGIGVTLGGLVNRTVSTWDGNVAVNDSGLTSTVSDLTRGVGENVGVYNITAGLFSAASGNYSAPVLTGSPTLTIGQAGLTGAIANQNKTYGADDPLLSGIGVTLGGLVNRTVSTWDGNVAVNDSGLTSTVSDLTRGVGENVGVYNITAGLFSAASGNYSAPVLTGSPTLTIGQAGLTGAIANQNKTYGADDPLLSGIGVTLGGLVNRTVSTWDGNVAVNDSGLTSTVSDLTRGVGENVGVYNITAGLFSAASGNYSAPVLTGSPTLTIGQAGLTGAIANQNKTYGADDPLLSGIGVTLGGLVNRTVSTWDGNVAVNDSGLTSTVSDLTRGVGENVGVYNITAGLFSAASGNYSAPVLTGSPTLTIGQAGLTGAIANQNKTYGADDPLLSGIGVTLGGLVNRTVSTWDGNVAVNDSGLTSTVSDLTRGVGENVGVYNITAGLFSAASGNYSAPVLTGSPTLTIGPVALTIDLTTNASKSYGTNDPAVSATTPTFTGRVNRSVTSWNGGAPTPIDDTVAGRITLASLTRDPGESVASYNITGGAAGGTAIGNYTPTVNTNARVLAITAAALTAGISDPTKTFGTDDPALGTVGLATTGLVNGVTVTNWMGQPTTINDTATLASLTRDTGENVGNYAITDGTLNLSAPGNYTTSFNVASNKLVIVAPSPSTVINPTVTTWDPQPGTVDINFTWTASGNGSWETGSNWSKGFAPPNGAVVTIPDIGAAGVTHAITYSGGTLNLRSLTSYEALTVTGGTLNLGTFIAGVSTIYGSVNVATLNLISGILNGNGTIIGNVNNTGGTVTPGVSPGTLTINGNYVQGPGGTLSIEIGGTAAGTQYDQLIVTGNATLGGALGVALINGFVPASGSSFSVVQGGTVSGVFATTNLPSTPLMTTDYLASNVNVLANASQPLAQLPPSAPAPPLIDQLPGLPESGSGTGLNIVTVVNPETGQREILDGFLGQNIVTTVNPETGERQILDGAVGQNLVTTVNPQTGEREIVDITAGDSRSGGKIGVCK